MLAHFFKHNSAFLFCGQVFLLDELQLDEQQRALINERVNIRHEYERNGVTFINEVLGPLLTHHQPDLVWLDPVLQYLGGDGNQQEVVGEFLRSHLSPLIKRFHCAVILIHHTNKPSRSNHQQRQTHLQHAYDGAGSAEFSNWPRAVLSLPVLLLKRACHPIAVFPLPDRLAISAASPTAVLELPVLFNNKATDPMLVL